MPILRNEDAPEFDLSGIRIRGLSSPSRGASETVTYRVDLGPGQRVPEHTHDHEEVFHVISGRVTASLDGQETVLGPGDTVMVPPGSTHFTYTAEGEETVLLAAVPAGTLMIRGDERAPAPWAM